ncbi:MAG: T9SS type A sorting domain-containing protein [Bacteroidales bacterium]|nr:T9SS type A sorting domain-containing protein [Bacteroidales bacterium]
MKNLQQRNFFIVNWILHLILGFSITTNSFARTYDGYEKIYLRPAGADIDWLGSGAKVGMYFNDGTSGVFVELFWLVDNDGGNIWSASVPSGNWTQVIVTRHSTSPITWENKWNQTGDISIPTVENYIQSFSNNSSTATWQTLNAHYRSKATGNWSALATWRASFDSNWDNAWNYFDAHYIPNNNDLSVTIMDGHTVTLNQATVISSLKINSGATFTASDATPRILTIAKSASGSSTTLSNNGTWANGTGGSTVIFTGAPSSGDAIHTISGIIAFQNITLNKTGGSSNIGASFGANSSVSGTLEIGTGGFISTAPPSSFYGANAILKFNQGSGANYNVGASDYTWSTSVIPNFITISSGTVNLNTARTASGNLLIDGGALVLNAGLIIEGNWTRSSGTFTPNTQTVTLSGATNTIINTATDATLYDMVVSKTGGAFVTLENNLTVSHDLTISANAILRVPSGKGLTVNGTITNNAGVTGLVIKSDITGTGSLINSTADVEATVERYLTDYETTNDQRYHFISSPVETQAIQPEFVANSPVGGEDFYYFDELTNMWINSKAEGGGWNSGFEDNFIVGKGYLVAYPEIVTKNFTGELNTYPSATPLVLTCTNTTGQGNGWNLLGNPFPSAIDWNSVARGDGMDNALYYYDNAQQNYRYYILLAGDTQTDLGSGQQYIPAMQGFMVHAKSTGTKTVTIDNDDRTHNGQNVFYKSSNTTPGSFSLKAIGNGYEDEAFIHFSENATTAFDGDADAYKLRSYSELVPMIYTMGSDNNQLAINGLPAFELSTVIPVYFEAGVDGDYSIEANLEAFNEADVYLEDKLLNQVQNLSDNPVYGFTALAGAEADRFNVYFSPVGINDPSTASRINIFTSDNNLLISGASANAEIVVTNLLGQVVLQGKASNAGLTVIGTGSLNDGIYVVTVVSGKQAVSKKISIR